MIHCGSGALALRIAVRRVFGVHACRRRYPAQPDHHGDDVDLDLDQIEVARHLPQFLAFAGKYLRDIDTRLIVR